MTFWPTSIGPAGPILATATSAAAPSVFPGFSVVVVVARLLAGLGSGVVLETLATFVRSVPVGPPKGPTWAVKVAAAFGARLAVVHTCAPCANGLPGVRAQVQPAGGPV